MTKKYGLAAAEAARGSLAVSRVRPPPQKTYLAARASATKARVFARAVRATVCGFCCQ